MCGSQCWAGALGIRKRYALSPQSHRRKEAWLELLGAGRGRGVGMGGHHLVFLLGSQARGEVGKALPGIINRLSIKDLIYSSI